MDCNTKILEYKWLIFGGTDYPINLSPQEQIIWCLLWLGYTHSFKPIVMGSIEASCRAHVTL